MKNRGQVWTGQTRQARHVGLVLLLVCFLLAPVTFIFGLWLCRYNYDDSYGPEILMLSMIFICPWLGITKLIFRF